MAMDGTGLSVADAMALTKGSGEEGFMGGSGLWVFFLFFLLAWGGNGMFGGNGAAAATALGQSQLQLDLFNQTLDSNVRTLAIGQCDLTKEVLNNRYESAIQTTNSQFAVQSQLQAMEAARAQCCCETNRNIDAVRYENAQNTASIINANTMNTQRIMDLMNQNTIQDLRDRLQDEKYALSQCQQNEFLLGQLQPLPRPAYITASPYATFNNGCGGLV